MNRSHYFKNWGRVVCSLFAAIIVWGIWSPALAVNSTPFQGGTEYWIKYQNRNRAGYPAEAGGLLPSYIWATGCAPTATAMVLTYWDIYGEVDNASYGGYEGGVKYTYWGDLLRFYQDSQCIESILAAGGGGYYRTRSNHVYSPDLLVDLANAMETTAAGAVTEYNIEPGLNQVTSNRGYGSNWADYYETSIFFPTRWSTIKEEINSERPCVWVMNYYDFWDDMWIGHAVTVWGYIEGGTYDEYLILYDTWHETRVEWPIDDPDAKISLGVLAVRPQGGTGGQDIYYESPQSGTYTGGSTMAIRWHQYWTAIDNAYLQYSTNGGSNWSTIVSWVSSRLGDNEYPWVIPTTINSSRVKIRISAYQGNTLMARDGSKENISITPPTNYTLTVNSSGASGVVISSTTGHGSTTNYTRTVASGTTVRLTAPATVGTMAFTGWTGAVTSSNRTIEFSVTGNRTVIANYQAQPTYYTLTVSSLGASGVVISSTTGHGGTTNYTRTVASGTTVRLTAPATVGAMVFTGWTGSVTSSGQTIEFSMTGNRTVTANYAPGGSGCCDDFESYPLNAWPDRWSADGNATSDGTNNRMVSDPIGATNQVLKLYGVLGEYWGALGYLPCDIPVEFILDVDIYNGAETIPSGGHQRRGGVGLRSGTHWSNYARGLIEFDKEGNAIRSVGGWIFEFALEQWHSVRIHYRRVGTVLTLSYWINEQNAGTVNLDIADLAQEESLNHIDLHANAGSAYFDNVCLQPGTYNTLSVKSNRPEPVNISSTTGHGGTTNYTRAVPPGTTVRLTAPATRGRLVFTGWTGSVTSENQTIEFSMTGNRTVTANYILAQYTLVITANAGGATNPLPGDYIYDSGTEVPITATAESGYRFSHWTGDVPSGHENDNPITITMDSDKSIAANFIRQYTLTIAAGAGGATDPEPGTYIYDSGTEVPITATAESGYRFSHWTGDVPSGHENDNPITITMDSDKSITANFIRQYTLTIASGSGGTTSPSPGTYVHDSGTEVSITAKPDSGYEFSGWSGDASGTDNPTTITMNSDKSVTASFSATTTDGDEPGEKKGPCFIATAAYGSPLHPHLDILRDFRDAYLMPSKLGRTLVNLYYKYSPFVADFIAKHKVLKIVVRFSLLPMITFSYSMVRFGPIITAVMLVLILVLPILSILLYRKKKSRQ